jgi:two-component system response regulator GlrR
MQPKLLRVLEERVVKRIGMVDPIKLDVRVIAATNRDLRQEVNRGAFRSDLFYRLNVVRVRLPPLRERRDDIPLLAAHFYAQLEPGSDEGPPGELVEALLRQDWPGNVRELRAAIERSVLLGDPDLWREIAPATLLPPPDTGAKAGAEAGSGADAGSGAGAGDGSGAGAGPGDGPDADAQSHSKRSPAPPGASIDASADEAALDPSLSFRVAKEQLVARWERAYLRALLRAHGGNVSGAARAARMDRNHLRELLRRHAISARED